MRELTTNEVQNVNGGIVPVIIAVVTNPLVQLAAKTVITTVVAAVVGTAVYNAVKK